MPPRQSQADPVNQDMILGEMRGQLRELVHNVNNLSGKFDGLTREVIALGPLAADISEIKTRLKALEDAGNQQLGAKNVLIAFLHSPVIAWLFAIAVAAWTYFKAPPQ